MNIGERYIVTILDQDNIGNGIARINNAVVFIKNAIINEEIEIEITDIKKKYYVGRIVNIIKKSKDRIKPLCEYYDKCGGCNFMHSSFSNENKVKKDYIQKLFNRDIEYYHTDNYDYYRNKVTLHVNNAKLGYYNDKTHELCVINHCMLLNPKINSKIDNLNKIDLTGINEIMIRCINDQIMINVLGNIKELNIDCDSLYINNKYIRGKKYLIDETNNYKFTIYPESFYQVNKECMIKLYDKAYEYTKTGNSLLDLYCGTGTIGIWMNDLYKKITGVEINPISIKNANLNKELNNLENIDFICSDAKNIKGNFDSIIVDPPRNGLSKEVINYLNNSKSKRIVYISCNPNTLKRDVELLIKYELKEISAFNMFPRTKHCESVCVLERRNNYDVFSSK